MLDIDADADEIAALLDLPDLSAEQRVRLLEIARQRILFAPSGALGIEMQELLLPNPRNPGTVLIGIRGLLEDLPARDVLQIGDRIEQIDGRYFTDRTELVMYVQRRRPGDEIRLTVLRPRPEEPGGDADFNPEDVTTFDELELTMELGSARKLRSRRTGRAQPPAVARERQMRFARLADTHGLRPALVRLAAPADADAARGLVAWARAETASPREHVLVAELRDEIRLLEARGATPSRAWMSLWRGRERQLMVTAGNPGLTDAEREYLHAVSQLLRDLLSDVQPSSPTP